MRALIVDDESLAAQYLFDLIHSICPEIEFTDIALSAKEGLSRMDEICYDVVFLDVEMPGMNGFEWIANLKANQNPQILFTSAYSEYAIKAFRANAVDFLLKPIVKEELIAAVQKTQDLSKRNNPVDLFGNITTVFDGDSYRFIKNEDIIYIKAERSYCCFELVGGDRIISSKALSAYSAVLVEKNFIRCHRSYLINVDHITQMTKALGGGVTMVNHHEIPVSSGMKEIFKRVLNRY